MAIRALNGQHDWTFGMGKNSYLQDEKEIVENLETRVLSFLGDCFFATDEGIDWFNLLGSLNKRAEEIEYKVQEVIKNTPGVVGINSVDVVTGANRKLTIQYSIDTIFSQAYTGEVVPLYTNGGTE